MKPYIYSILICIVCVICNSCNSSPTGLGEEIPDSVDMISFFTKNPKWTKYDYYSNSDIFSQKEEYWSPWRLNTPIYFANDSANNCLWKIIQETHNCSSFPDTLNSLNKKLIGKSTFSVESYDIETDSYVPWASVTTITYTYETSRSVTLVENIKKFEKGKEVSNKNRYYWLRR